MRFCLLVCLALVLAGCAAQPDYEGMAVLVEAESVAAQREQLTQQEVAAMIQARQVELMREEIAIRELSRRQAQATEVGNRVVVWLGVALAILAMGLAVSVAILAVGASVANSARAIVNVAKIYPDVNGNYPLLPVPKGVRFMLVDPGNHGVLDTGKQHEPVPQLVKANAYRMTTAVLAEKARNSRDPLSVVSARPLLIEESVETSVDAKE